MDTMGLAESISPKPRDDVTKEEEEGGGVVPDGPEDEEAPPASVPPVQPIPLPQGTSPVTSSEAAACPPLEPSRPPSTQAHTRQLPSISPSLVGRFFGLNRCERWLRRRLLGGSAVDSDSSSFGLTTAGTKWEEEVVRRLGGAVLVKELEVVEGRPVIPVSARFFTPEETDTLLRESSPGKMLYQLTLRPPKTLFDRFPEVDATRFRFSECRPDLIEVLGHRRSDGTVEKMFRAVDVKLRSGFPKVGHMAQVAMYALLLDELVKDAGMENVSVDLTTGGVWLGGAEWYTEISLEIIMPIVEGLLRSGLFGRGGGVPDIEEWHLTSACEHCPFIRVGLGSELCCWDDAFRKGGHLSLIPRVTPSVRRFLCSEGVPSVEELKKRAAEGDMTGSHRLRGRGKEVLASCTAVCDARPGVSGLVDPAFPHRQGVAVHVVVGQEQITRGCFMWGVLLFPSESPELPTVRVALRKEDMPGCARSLVRHLYGVVKRVSDRNQGGGGEDLSVQLFTNVSHAVGSLGEILQSCLLDEDQDVASKAQLLLQCVDPPIPLRETVHRVFAFPEGVLSSLSSVVRHLAVWMKFQPFEELEDVELPGVFSWSIGLDTIHRIWLGAVEERDGLEKSLWWFLRALSNLRALIQLHPDVQFAQTEPSTFSLPSNDGSSSFTSPLLARLAFIVLTEKRAACEALRFERADWLERCVESGSAVLLRREQSWMRVVEARTRLEVLGWPQWFLVPLSEEGWKAQQRFPDWDLCEHPKGRDRWPQVDGGRLCAIRDVQKEGGRVNMLRLSGFHEEIDYVLCERFRDQTSSRLIDRLGEEDESEGHLLDGLLRGEELLVPQLPAADRVRELGKLVGLTGAQQKALDMILDNKLTCVWGPPGTGKTRFLASLIVCMALASSKQELSFKVLVVTLTHTAVGNVFRAVAEILAHPGLEGQGACPLLQVKMDRPPSKDARGLPPSCEMRDQWIQKMTSSSCLMVGATVAKCVSAKWLDQGASFDMVILDEATQMRVADLGAVMRFVPEGKRLVLGGDDKQLGPIMRGEYAEGPGVCLSGSAFEALKASYGNHHCTMLDEGFRMNDVICSVVAHRLYPGLRCHNSDVAERRLALQGDTQESLRSMGELGELLWLCLDPAAPVVMVVLDGRSCAVEGQNGGRSSVTEAKVVSGLVLALRRFGLRREVGDDTTPWPADGAQFCEEACFVVCPHRVHVDLVKENVRSRLEGHLGEGCNVITDTVERMQGQEAEAVVVSYGVCDEELIGQEARFIFDTRRLNVAFTRARAKVVVLVSEFLLKPPPAVLDVPKAVEGLGCLRELSRFTAQGGNCHRVELDGIGLTVQQMRGVV